jgi:hypothetical protein
MSNRIHHFLNRLYNNSNYSKFFSHAVNFAIELQETIQNDNRLPANCTLSPRNVASGYVIQIEYNHPGSSHTGKIMITIPHDLDYDIATGFVKMHCNIDAHSRFFLELMVNSLDEMYDVISFCQNLLQYQPDESYLHYVRVPSHLLNHWCVSPMLRYLNLNPPP